MWPGCRQNWQGVPATAQAPGFPSQHVPQPDLREGVPGSSNSHKVRKDEDSTAGLRNARGQICYRSHWKCLVFGVWSLDLNPGFPSNPGKITQSFWTLIFSFVNGDNICIFLPGLSWGLNDTIMSKGLAGGYVLHTHVAEETEPQDPSLLLNWRLWWGSRKARPWA